MSYKGKVVGIFMPMLIVGLLGLTACDSGSQGTGTGSTSVATPTAATSSTGSDPASGSATPTTAASGDTGGAADPTAPQAGATDPATSASACARLNLNELTGDQLTAVIPNFPDRMIREFLEYRPYSSIQQFRKEIGKYVGDPQTAEWEKYIYVPVDQNNSDAETLKQLPGVTDAVVAQLISGRPYASNDAFLQALSTQVSADQAAQVKCYVGAAQ